ncbi:hypothetical protein OCU04_010134 [Sclerotinia nivalis]|uniref:Uncharacterized protein n=1 Tax=Sclerotinia nivalis TaxID=352851 RepID=A0A9X0AE38_9HELO|nr:hypothetical protein OCU04_010134 [Sclerotinia nivalis]
MVHKFVRRNLNQKIQLGIEEDLFREDIESCGDIVGFIIEDVGGNPRTVRTTMKKGIKNPIRQPSTPTQSQSPKRTNKGSRSSPLSIRLLSLEKKTPSLQRSKAKRFHSRVSRFGSSSRLESVALVENTEGGRLLKK